MENIVEQGIRVGLPSVAGVSVNRHYIIQARHQFVALGLIVSVDNISHTSRTDNEIDEITWDLTEKGRRYFARLNALKRPVRS